MTEKYKSNMQKVLLCKLPQSKEVCIPTDWEIKTISRVTKVNPETISNNYNHSEILYIDISSIDDYEIKKFEKYLVSERPSRAQRIVQKNDILISTVRPYLLGFTKVIESEPNLICSTGFSVLRTKNPEDIEFIYNYIRSEHFQINILRHMEGLAYPAVSNSVIRKSLIPFPKNIAERKKIGEILLNYDNLIKTRKKIIRNEEYLLDDLIQDLCIKGLVNTNLVEKQFHPRVIKESIPSHWKIDQLQNIITKKPQNGININLEDYGVGQPIIEIDSLYRSEFYLKLDNLRNAPVSETELEKYMLINDDFLINRVSKIREGSGKLVLVNNNLGKLIFEGNIIRFHIDEDIILPKFFEYFSWTHLYKKYIQSTCKTTTLTSIDQDIILKIPIVIPPCDEQEKIISIISNQIDKINIQRDILNKSQTIKNGLIQRLLTGQIRVKMVNSDMTKTK